jgi:hypothetical protein
MAEIKGRGAHIFSITSITGHPHITFPILTEGLSPASAEFTNFTGQIKMANHTIPNFDIVDFTADLDNLSCDFMTQNSWIMSDEPWGAFHDDDRQSNPCSPDPNLCVARPHTGFIHLLECYRTSQLMK